MNAAKATAATRPVPIASAASASVFPLHLAVPERPMTQRRIRTTSQHEQIIPGPAFPAQQVADAITTAQTEEKVHPAEVHCRIEVAGDGRPQLVVFYVQETTQ